MSHQRLPLRLHLPVKVLRCEVEIGAMNPSSPGWWFASNARTSDGQIRLQYVALTQKWTHQRTLPPRDRTASNARDRNLE